MSPIICMLIDMLKEELTISRICHKTLMSTTAIPDWIEDKTFKNHQNCMEL